MKRVAATIFLLLSVVASPARALCSYGGVLYAETTIPQEFHDSKWVVRAKVTSVTDYWSDDDASWTRYSLRVLSALKGHLNSHVKFFTYRDSGGFYLGKGPSTGLGDEYLLFLDPIRPNDGHPNAAIGAAQVNYACGQSKPWADVSASEREQLDKLSNLSLR